MIDFVAYMRVSTDKQGITGLGMDAQRESVLRYVSTRGRLLAEFIEVESGRKENRPQLKAALEECRRRKAVLLIARLDRLARNVAFIANLMNSDVEFVAVDMPQANRLTIHILAAVAEHEREMISQRTKAALGAAKARGIKLGNPRYHEALIRAREALQYKPPPAEVVRLMSEWRDQGDVLRRIATRLNELNIRTPQGCRWYASTVRTVLLKNEIAQALYDAMTNARYDDVALECIDVIAQARNNESAPTSLLPVNAIPATPVFSPNAGPGLKTGDTPMPSNVVEAERMLDLFTSVGAREFVLTRYDIEKNVKWGKHYLPQGLRETLPITMRLAAMRYKYTLKDGRTVQTGDNLAIRPTGPGVSFFQLDDLTQDYLSRVRPAAFLMHETSPGNYQAWIAVSGLPDDKEATKAFMRRIRKAVGGNDKSASGSTRLAGTENFKPNYGPEYPVVNIIHAIPGRVMTPDQLTLMGLLAAPEPVTVSQSHSPTTSNGRAWPSYRICLERAPLKKDGTPDRSKADFAFALTSLTGGKSIEETVAKLMEVSDRAKERQHSDPGYARVTVDNAAKCVAQNYGKSRSRG